MLTGYSMYVWGRFASYTSNKVVLRLPLLHDTGTTQERYLMVAFEAFSSAFRVTPWSTLCNTFSFFFCVFVPDGILNISR